MEITTENVRMVIKEQIENSQKQLVQASYDAPQVRKRVALLSQRYGSTALDVGTGACACLAVALAQKGLKVTAVDHASGAVRIAQERVVEAFAELIEIRHMDAEKLSLPDRSFQVVTAFDALCHTPQPAIVLREMFRVSSRVVIITELNTAGREMTKHHDIGFESELPALLAENCMSCQRVDDPHHVTYICEKSGDLPSSQARQ